jgi:V/A-type H+-transporting ATPase subunit K
MVKLSLWSVGAVLAVVLMPGVPALAQQAAQEGVAAASLGRTIGLAVAAAFAVGVSILGAGYAVGKIGSAALGAAVEKPELLTRSILFVALAEGLAVLGFAIAMMLLQKI